MNLLTSATSELLCKSCVLKFSPKYHKCHCRCDSNVERERERERERGVHLTSDTTVISSISKSPPNTQSCFTTRKYKQSMSNLKRGKWRLSCQSGDCPIEFVVIKRLYIKLRSYYMHKSKFLSFCMHKLMGFQEHPN